MPKAVLVDPRDVDLAVVFEGETDGEVETKIRRYFEDTLRSKGIQVPEGMETEDVFKSQHDEAMLFRPHEVEVA